MPKSESRIIESWDNLDYFQTMCGFWKWKGQKSKSDAHLLHNLGRFFYYLPSAEPVTIRSSFFNDLHTNHRRISTFRTHPPPPYVSAPRTIFKIALNFTFCLSVHFFRPEKMTLEGVIGVRSFQTKDLLLTQGCKDAIIVVIAMLS